MRVIVVLAILALALIATILLRREQEGSFDHRFNAAERQIREMAEDIDRDIEANEKGDELAE